MSSFSFQPDHYKVYILFIFTLRSTEGFIRLHLLKRRKVRGYVTDKNLANDAMRKLTYEALPCILGASTIS